MEGEKERLLMVQAPGGGRKGIEETKQTEGKDLNLREHTCS